MILPAVLPVAGGLGAVSTVPTTINHQGVVAVDGVKYTGSGLFKFAIIDPETGNNVWTHDGSKTMPPDQSDEPTGFVELTVTDGVYSVALGKTPAMIAISPELFVDATLALRVWFNDGTHGWQQLSPDQLLSSVPYAFAAGMSGPPGLIQAYAGPSAPAGWLLCDGSAVSRTMYADLYAVVGDAYGAGDGSTSFNLPDLRGRVPMGVDGSANRIPSNNALGNSGGGASVNLAHTHTTGDWTLTISQIPAHAHQQTAMTSPVAAGGGSNVAGMAFAGSGTPAGAQQHTVSTGGGQAHNHGHTGSALSSTQSVLNPYQIVHYIIKH